MKHIFLLNPVLVSSLHANRKKKSFKCFMLSTADNTCCFWVHADGWWTSPPLTWMDVYGGVSHTVHTWTAFYWACHHSRRYLHPAHFLKGFSSMIKFQRCRRGVWGRNRFFFPLLSRRCRSGVICSVAVTVRVTDELRPSDFSLWLSISKYSTAEQRDKQPLVCLIKQETFVAGCCYK